MNKFAIASMLIFSVTGYANEAEHTGTISRLMGTASVLSNPSKTVPGVPPHALFEGLYYSEQAAKVGSKIRVGEVLQTGKIGRARVIFPNGDQFTVGPQTAFKIEYDPNNGVKTPEVDLSRGKLRSLIETGGPRSDMKVRTRSAVMGVRGTDFFVNAYTKTGTSEVTVIRGEVEVAPQSTTPVEPINVPAGYSAVVNRPAPTHEQAKADVKIEPAKPAQINNIAKLTTIAKNAPSTIDDVTVREEITRLEQKAVATTLKDIKQHDAALFEALQKAAPANGDVDKINTAVSAELSKAVESHQKASKAKKPDLNSPGENIYDKYYKN